MKAGFRVVWLSAIHTLLVALGAAMGNSDVRAQTSPQGWMCLASTPGFYCGGGTPRGPFGGAISGCHWMADFWLEQSVAYACDVVKSRDGFYSFKLDWHEVVMHYSCGAGQTRGTNRCLSCPSGQVPQVDGTCAVPPVCKAPRDMSTGPCTIPPATPEPDKELGEPACSEGNPCNLANGNKYQHEADYVGPGPYPLRNERFYNSGPVEQGAFTNKWRNFYDRSVVFATDGTVSTARVKRADGKQYHFSLSGASWLGDADVVGKLERLLDAGGTPIGWTYTTEADEAETYDVEGKLVSLTNRAGLTQTLTYSCKTLSSTCPVVTPSTIAPVAGLLITATDPAGRQLNFTYDSDAHLIKVTDPSGGNTHYGYVNGAVKSGTNLFSVVYPDGKYVSYRYGEAAYVSSTPVTGVSYNHALTGKFDENGNRFATWSYDDQGRAKTSEHGVGVEKITLNYRTGGTVSVADAIGGSRTYEFQTILGARKATALTRHDSSSIAHTYL